MVLDSNPTFVEDTTGSVPYFTQGIDVAPLFHRHTDIFLGSHESDDGHEHVQRCFNCGTPEHIVTTCPLPVDHQLVALSRQYYNFFVRSTRQAPLFDLHDLQAAHEHQARRLGWIEEFVPGEIRGALLKEALDLFEDDPGERVEWLTRIADWGYPKGWTGEENPVGVVRRRILQDRPVDADSEDEGAEEFLIYGDEDVEELVLRSRSSPTSGVPGGGHEEPSVVLGENDISALGHARRWASYPPTFFTSSFLTIYSGASLSSISPSSLRPNGWRLPGGLADEDVAEWKTRIGVVATRGGGRTFTQDRRALWDQISSSVKPSAVPLPVPPSPSLPPPPVGPPPRTPPPPPPPMQSLPQAPVWSIAGRGDEEDGASDMDLSDSD